MKDFFTRYREFHKNPVVLPALFGLTLSFALVATMQWTNVDLKSISANVVSGIEQKQSFPADLMMNLDGGDLVFIIGKDALNVKTLYFTLLGNPQVLEKVETKDEKTTISMNESGVALVRVTVGASLKAGDQITRVTPKLQGETPITVIDAGFSSDSGDYSLSVKGE